YNDWPDASLADFGLTRESFDIFLVTRSWFTYSQENLPPPNPNPGLSEGRPPNPLRERMPRRPTIIIFRGFPARAQAYLAESLQEEGWFDEQGWFIRDWFRDIEQPEVGLLVGDQIKYHSGLAWAKAADRYREYGRENGLYLDPDKRREWVEKAKAFEAHAKITTAERATAPPRNAPKELKDSFIAHEKLHWNQVYKGMTNYDGLLHESEAKSLPQAVAALKLYNMADAWRKKAPPVTMVYYERNEATNQYEAKTAPLLSVYDRAH